ncbi:MAG: hypothetical protein K2Q18_03910, partial [Bdellovibrionales bacterium]|nr:hypothetical protein [Bdellovibrionales bacterium]
SREELAMTFGKFICSLFFTALLFQNVSSASDNEDPLQNITVSKAEIDKSLDKMRSDGKISVQDYNSAKKELAGMSDTHVTAIKELAVGMIRNNPDKALELVQAPKVDLEEAQRQINALSNPK